MSESKHGPVSQDAGPVVRNISFGPPGINETAAEIRERFFGHKRASFTLPDIYVLLNEIDRLKQPQPTIATDRDRLVVENAEMLKALEKWMVYANKEDSIDGMDAIQLTKPILAAHQPTTTESEELEAAEKQDIAKDERGLLITYLHKYSMHLDSCPANKGVGNKCNCYLVDVLAAYPKVNNDFGLVLDQETNESEDNRKVKP
jgi:hypothetical protein